ncbi:MAG TPA: TolC family protein, partial [Dongiaceae bacterium]|nr:TolC family protein [Dongiaceae bacterium]
SRGALRASFKAALGLTPDQPDPPTPAKLDLSPALPSDAELWQAALARNPELKAMAAEIRTAQAGIAVAYKDRVPDFSLGLMVDVKTSPTMLRPLGGMTLPIWRDKLAAELAQARAQELAARSQWNAAQISLAMTFAEKTFGYREINRNLDLLQEGLVPKARQSLELARANYLAGTLDFFNLMDAQRTLLMFELAEVEARTQREIIMADLSLLIAGTASNENPLPQNILQP